MNYLISVDTVNHNDNGRKKTYDFWATNRLSGEQKIEKFRRTHKAVEIKTLHYKGYQEHE